MVVRKNELVIPDAKEKTVAGGNNLSRIAKLGERLLEYARPILPSSLRQKWFSSKSQDVFIQTVQPLRETIIDFPMVVGNEATNGFYPIYPASPDPKYGLSGSMASKKDFKL